MRDADLRCLRSTTGETMALQGVTARGNVRGLLFELTVEQRYRNPGTKNVEAVYTFPLPFERRAARPRRRARRPQARGAWWSRRRTAKAATRRRSTRATPRSCSSTPATASTRVNLGNLMAGESATIRYRYAQLLRFEHGSVRLAVPTVIAPRYGDPAAAGLAPHQVPTHRPGAARTRSR